MIITTSQAELDNLEPILSDNRVYLFQGRENIDHERLFDYRKEDLKLLDVEHSEEFISIFANVGL